jgi:hypothetical protein
MGFHAFPPAIASDATEALSQQEDFFKVVSRSRSTRSASTAIVGRPKENSVYPGLHIQRGR